MKVPRLSEADDQAALGVVELEEGAYAVLRRSERLETVDEPVTRTVTATGDRSGLLRFGCDCPWDFLGSGHGSYPCRHIRAVLALLRTRASVT